ncbi:MAG: IS3 family transposase [Chordicoccus sp.]
MSLVLHTVQYHAISRLAETRDYPVHRLCRYAHVASSAYYRWKKCPVSAREREDEHLAGLLRKHHEEHPEKGYRRLRDDLETEDHIRINDKRAHRICRKQRIQSTIRWRPKGCTRGAVDPMYVAGNILNRNFSAERPDQKWLTDVSEFKYYTGTEARKIYLSAVLDLYDRRIVAYEISDHNDNPLVMRTFDDAVAAVPDAHPLVHSDRGFQYTSREFHQRLLDHGMTQSMSRVGRCIDNGPMEGFWGMLKRESYYGRKFTDRDSLETMIRNYIRYYNMERTQRRLHLLTPAAYHRQYHTAA